MQKARFHRYDSDDVAARQRLSHLREFVGRKLTNTEIVPLTEDFRIQIALQQLPDLSIMRGSNTAHRFVGPFEPIRADDDLLLMWMRAPGEMRWGQGGVDLMLRDGVAALMGSEDRRRGENHAPVQYTTLKFKRARVEPLVANPEASRMIPIAADAEPLRLLKHYIAGIREEAMGEALSETVATHIFDLIALTLGATRDAADLASKRGLRLARLDAARKLARQNLADHCYSINDVARTMGLSPRTLQTLFRDEGTSFSAYMLAQRLALVRSQLRQGHKATQAIGTIAWDAGFGDLSHFNHAFRKAFGCTPSDVRAQADEALKQR